MCAGVSGSLVHAAIREDFVESAVDPAVGEGNFTSIEIVAFRADGTDFLRVLIGQKCRSCSVLATSVQD